MATGFEPQGSPSLPSRGPREPWLGSWPSQPAPPPEKLLERLKNYELGKSMPRWPEQLESLAKVLAVDSAWLRDGDPEHPGSDREPRARKSSVYVLEGGKKPQKLQLRATNNSSQGL